MTTYKENAVILRGSDLRRMFLEACNYFDLHKDSINELNVFPVPDGDTGTNMSLTINAAAKELQRIDSDSIGEVAQIMAKSALMGARGNSGVIFSQLFRGIARGLAGKKEAQLSEVAKAFQYGIVYAYNAVSKPVEGTILTVAREIARGSREAIQMSISFIDLLRIAVESGRNALERTPELLPILKEAGVVDAGGLGLVIFLEGCLQSMLRYSQEENTPLPFQEISDAVLDKGESNKKRFFRADYLEEFNPNYPYCTELLLKGEGISLKELRRALSEWGDSLVVVGEDELFKVHIHTAHPGNVLEICLLKGSIHDIKIENMMDQYKETRWSKSIMERENSNGSKVIKFDDSSISRIGIITISSGEGLFSIFANLGADKIVSGGQSMNPSVKEIVESIMDIEAQQVIILPNNSNIKLTALQASSMVEKEVVVIDTKSIPQGLSALLAFDRSKTLNENFTAMTKRAQMVKTGEVTYATRDASVNNVVVKKGQFIGIYNDRLVVSGNLLEETVLQLIRYLLTEDDELITIFYGQDVNNEQAEKLRGIILKEFPDVEVELQYGGQPLYYYLLSVE